MIEPEVVPPASPPRSRRLAVLAGVTVLAVVAGALSLTSGGSRSEGEPLALMAGNGGAEKAAVPAATGLAADSRSSAPYGYGYGGWGLTFKVDGELPDLPDHAAAWTMSGPALDRAGVARIAATLGVKGAPVQRDGGWFVEEGGRTLSAIDGGDTWSVNYYRSGEGVVANAAADAGSTGPALSRAEAERRVQDLVEAMNAPGGSWRVESTETEMGVGWACAAPAEAAKLQQQYPMAGGGSAGNAGSVAATPPPDLPSAPDGVPVSTTPGKPAPDRAVMPCPPPPAPVKGFSVSLYPVLDDRRADFSVWSVTLRSDGRVENLSGQWVTFERGGDYKLRGVSAALKDLTTAPEPPVAIMEGTATGTPTTLSSSSGSSSAVSSSAGSVSGGSSSAGSSSAGSEPSRLPADGGTTITDPAMPTPMAPSCGPQPMPMPVQTTVPGAKESSLSAMCVPPTPQVVTITGVELALMPAPAFQDGRVRLLLVPAYRFRGHFDNGTPWETSVIALHPDAIAPPPDFPVKDGVRDGGGIPAVGKSVPPVPAPAPAVETDSAPPRS